MMRRLTTTLLAFSLATLLLLLAGASLASAAAPWWHLTSGTLPPPLPAADEEGPGKGIVVVTAANLGDAPLNAISTPVTISDTLPAGVKATAISGVAETIGSGGPFGKLACSPKPATEPLHCAFEGTLAPYASLEVRIAVQVEASAETGARNEASVTGGDAQSATLARGLRIGGEPAFGVEDYELVPEEVGGALDFQAGSHPFQLTTTMTLDQSEAATSVQLAKDLNFKLPPGLIGNPTPFPQCSLGQFQTIVPSGDKNVNPNNLCSPQTAVGVARIQINEPSLNFGRPTTTFQVPVFNLEPAVGEPARFGFMALTTPVFLDTSVRTGGDYGVTVSVDNITQIISFLRSEVTFWGVPGDPSHDNARGWGCMEEARGLPKHGPCNASEINHPPPLLSLPTSCTGPLQTTVEADSWAAKGHFSSFPSQPMVALDGCNRLPFSFSITVAPDGLAGSTPTGLTVDVHVPQEEALNAEGLAPSDVKDTTVALPAGLALNPAAGDGLLACSLGQIALESREPPTCPDASKVGTVEVDTPLLAHSLVGAAYVAAQEANPFGSLVALYVFVEDPVSGSRVKLAGEVKPDPVTGQLVSTFLSTPQLPFEDFRLHFFGGDRAPLSTPADCGSYTTTASIPPWSGNEASNSSSTFDITSGPNGSPCASPLPFAPELTAGSTNIQAGAFTPFTTTMSRQDGQQPLQGIVLHMPPGLSGLLTGVKLCPESQANAGLCSANSEIGETTVSVGLGGDPFSVKGGKVFITEGYEGAPYGLSIVNPAKAGPYDLEKNTPCDCVVVRARIEVNPITAALTISTDTNGPYKIPTILDGIPLQIKHVNVLINKPGFTFNPTDCNPLQITGAIQGTQGASAPVSVPLQVTNCAALAFKPKFSVSTSGKTSRQKGASLHVKLVYPKAPFGSQVNIASVKVSLPKQLPSNLKTLQKACTAATFNTNPAACPAESRVGEAKATTPLLPVPLAGPAYFVSYGGAKFPELVVVLSGYGTTVQLHGETFINEHTSVTSSTFRTVPDVPVGTFELTLPQGKFSALAAPANNLCKETLKMPTRFVAQNGATLKQSTQITVTGCAKHKKKAKKTSKARHASHNKGAGK
jgi:hypothetical protein